MTMTPLERVARAILDADREFRGSDPISNEEWRNYWSPGGPTALPSAFAMRAKAALAAIRDVDAGTPAMLAAGKAALYSCTEDPEIEDARGCFHAMIDAALEER